MARRIGILMWLVVFLVGVLVIGLVLGLGLFSRLDAAQTTVNKLAPVFSPARVKADAAGMAMVSDIVNAVDPLIGPTSGGSVEADQLVGFLANKTGQTPAQVSTKLSTSFPAVLHMIDALPLSSVASELPGLITYLSTALHATTQQVATTLASQYPALAQSLAYLPALTSTWNNIPQTTNFTNLTGAKIHTLSLATAYIAGSVIPVLKPNETNYDHLANWGPKLNAIPWILLVIGIVVAIVGLLMMLRYAVGTGGMGEAFGTGLLVVLVGLLLIIGTVGTGLSSRLSGGQKLLNAASPIYTSARVTGTVSSVNVISTAVKVLDPIMTPTGGASAEVPKLVSLVATRINKTVPQTETLLAGVAPHATQLLLALPLSSVSAEIPGFLSYMATALHTTPTAVGATLNTQFPELTRTLTELPVVSSGWENVPGITGLTNFKGAKVTTVPELRDYFQGDVVPAIVHTESNFHTVANNSPQLTFFAPLLIWLGIIAIVWGLLIMAINGLLARRVSS